MQFIQKSIVFQGKDANIQLSNYSLFVTFKILLLIRDSNLSENLFYSKFWMWYIRISKFGLTDLKVKWEMEKQLCHRFDVWPLIFLRSSIVKCDMEYCP